MSDIFLSYAREDRERVRPLVEALQAVGSWSVWWDYRIPAGKTFDAVIERALAEARCVLVVWSGASISKHWVREEANVGWKRGILVPVRIDNVSPPLGFSIIQAADLIDWNGDTRSEVFTKLVADLSEILGWAQEQGNKRDAPRKDARRAQPYETKPAPRPLLVPEYISPPGRQDNVERKPLSVFRDRLQDSSEGPEMIVIPPGEFRMGDIQGSGSKEERPVHLVRIPRPFAMGRYAITFDEYDAFARLMMMNRGWLARLIGRGLPGDKGWGRGRRPVINISWEDARAYALWLSEQTGKRYRLPTEAEWEYAARAGTETAYWWGNEIGTNRANCDGCGSLWDNKQTAPVGSFPPNPWGLYDTLGNVWEWVQDFYHENYTGAPEDGSKAWEEGGDWKRRVLRGGSWGYKPWSVRSANRNGFVPDSRRYSLGFRLAQDLD